MAAAIFADNNIVWAVFKNDRMKSPERKRRDKNCFSDPEGVVSLIAGGVSLRKERLTFFFKPRRGDRTQIFSIRIIQK
jgi:hypothetical protein